jgi:hypothetical protein
MNCVNHPEALAKAPCPRCGKFFCNQCLARSGNQEICLACLAQSPSQPPTAVSNSAEPLCSPGTAFGLGLIPGVGAICNGEYLKAFVHVLIFGFMISVSNRQSIGTFEPLFGLMTVAFYFYMPLEAFHTAKRRMLQASGYQVEESKRNTRQESLWTGVLLTILGGLLFVNELVEGFLEQALKLWPAVLIGFGIYKIRGYLEGSKSLEAVEE